MARPRRSIVWWVDRGGAVTLAALIVYAIVAPGYIVDSDSAEFTTLGSVGGVAHPSGYPLYLMWLRLWSWLPGTPAHDAAFATAVLGAATVFVVHAACRAWGARVWPATAATAIFAFSPVVMRYSSEAEVFAMNELVVAVIAWLSAREGPLRGTARVAMLGLVAGAGLSDHVTCVLAAPVGIYGVVLGVRESSRRAVGIGAGAFVVGLLPYTYLLATGERSMSWAPIADLGGVLDHVLRRDYGGPWSFSPTGGDIDVGANLGALAMTLGRTWLWLPLVAGVVVLAMRCVARETRWSWLCLALAIMLAGPVVIARFDIAPTGVGLYIAQRFHLMSAVLLAIPVAVAFDIAGSWLTRTVVEPMPRVMAISVVVLGIATHAVISLVQLSASRSPAYDHAMRDLVTSLPPSSVVIGSGDTLYYGIGYVHEALADRPDVTFVLWPAIARRAWYRDRLARDGIVVDATTTSGQLAEMMWARGRPVYASISMTELLQSYLAYPLGMVFRVLPKTETPPSLEDIVATNQRLFDHFAIDYPVPSRRAEHAAFIHEAYAATWKMLGQALQQANLNDQAEVCFKRAEALAPTP